MAPIVFQKKNYPYYSIPEKSVDSKPPRFAKPRRFLTKISRATVHQKIFRISLLLGYCAICQMASDTWQKKEASIWRIPIRIFPRLVPISPENDLDSHGKYRQEFQAHYPHTASNPVWCHPWAVLKNRREVSLIFPEACR